MLILLSYSVRCLFTPVEFILRLLVTVSAILPYTDSCCWEYFSPFLFNDLCQNSALCVFVCACVCVKLLFCYHLYALNIFFICLTINNKRNNHKKIFWCCLFTMKELIKFNEWFQLLDSSLRSMNKYILLIDVIL